MGRGIAVGMAVVGLGLWLSGCSGSSKSSSDASCEAGVRRCDGSVVKQCDSDGGSEITVERCSAGQSCSDGECVGTACVPNTKFCKDGAVWKCDSTGDGSSLAQTCKNGESCVAAEDDAECGDTACRPGEPLCDGKFATECAADGAGPAPGGTDCSGSGLVCNLGKCQEQVCVPDSRVCRSGDLYHCPGNGIDLSLLAECGEDVCDGDVGACRPRVCEPGAKACDGSRVTQCNEFGSGQDPAADCAGEGLICADGSCQKQICVANATFCKEGSVYACNGTGTSSLLSQTCGFGSTHCAEFPGSNYAHCAYNQCTPGEVFCENNWVFSCTAEGTYGEGTACGGENYCDAGVCKPRVCTPFEYGCKDGDVYYCDSWGGLLQLAQECSVGTVCQTQAEGGAVCVSLPCEPESTACMANKIGTCAASGNALEAVTSDCVADGKVCTIAKTCDETAQDSFGVESELETQSSGTAIGDVIDVTSARKLKSIEASLVLVAPRDLRWVIFEQVEGNFVARVDKVVANQQGTDYFSSGELDYTLKAGRRYLLAVAVTGGTFGSLFDVAPWTPDRVSFGRSVGGLAFYYASSLSAEYFSDRLYRMRTTTTLP